MLAVELERPEIMTASSFANLQFAVDRYTRSLKPTSPTLIGEVAVLCDAFLFAQQHGFMPNALCLLSTTSGCNATLRRSVGS